MGCGWHGACSAQSRCRAEGPWQVSPPSSGHCAILRSLRWKPPAPQLLVQEDQGPQRAQRQLMGSGKDGVAPGEPGSPGSATSPGTPRSPAGPLLSAVGPGPVLPVCPLFPTLPLLPVIPTIPGTPCLPVGTQHVASSAPQTLSPCSMGKEFRGQSWLPQKDPEPKWTEASC